jgi:hypothetical protein
MVRLFDKGANGGDCGPKPYAEATFSYYNRSGRQAIGRIRDLLEDWFSRYPEPRKPSLRERFRSSDDVAHQSAFFELFLHELLVRLGCKVTVEPPLAGTAQHPDFLVSSPTGAQFYVEAVLATDESKQAVVAKRRLHQLWDIVNRRLCSPDFLIGAEFETAPPRQPRCRRIIAFLSEHLARLDPDDIRGVWERGGSQALPRWPYEQDGWTISFYPIPKSPETSGESAFDSLGIWGDKEFHAVEPHVAIREAILGKAKRYGTLDSPYVIAVNALGQWVRMHARRHVMNALCGTEMMVAYPGATSFVPGRNPDGAWRNRAGPRCERVSAVLVAVGLTCWNLTDADVCLYHHPSATLRYASALCRLPQVVPTGGRMVYVGGESVGDCLGLAPDWPSQ